MPYAMSVIVSRALPEIDGFKPAHRKLLYTMYKMGLLKGARTKSRQHRGQHHAPEPPRRCRPSTTRMVRLARGNESLLRALCGFQGQLRQGLLAGIWPMPPPVIPRPSWSTICEELFRRHRQGHRRFCATTTTAPRTEPTLLPVTFPTILVEQYAGHRGRHGQQHLLLQSGRALRDHHRADEGRRGRPARPPCPAPDFVGGGADPLRRGGDATRSTRPAAAACGCAAKYELRQGRTTCIEITQIPPTTTVEAIMDKITELVKAGKLKEISDMRDETDLNGLEAHHRPQARAGPGQADGRSCSRLTPLEDSFACNFNVLIGGHAPGAGGAGDSAASGSAFRAECVRRRTYFDLQGQEEAAAPAARAWSRSCWTSTRPSASSGRPRRRPRWCPT